MSFTFMSFTFTIGNTSSETLLSFMSFTYTSFTLPQFTFCFVGNVTQYCLSLYLANTSSGTILSFMYFVYLNIPSWFERTVGWFIYDVFIF